MSAWAAAKPAASSWADDAEKDDDDIGSVPAPVSAFPLPAKQSEDAFPSLAQSVSSAKATKKKEKKKATTISLSEFATGVYVGPGAKSRQASIQDSSKGLTVQEMMILPTGPRERSEEEGQQGLGGAFSAYGGGRGGDRRDDRDREGRGGFGRDRDSGFGRDRDRDGEDDGPSRADEVSNWGEAKKFVPSSSFAGSGGSRGGGGGGFRDRFDDDRQPVEREGPSRADEADNWGSAKKFTPSASSPALGNSWGRGGGGGFDGPDRRGGGFDGPDRRGVGGGPDGPSKADEVDNWGAAKKFVPSSSTSSSSSAGGSRGGFDGSGSRDLDADRWGKREGVGSAGSGSTDRPTGERPRLNLQKRTVPLPGEEGAPKENGSAATVDGESKPSKSDPFGGAKPREVVLTEKGVKVEEEPLKANGVDAKAAAGEVAAAASAPSRPKPNPFGSARPREVALEEKGKDWRKLDEELEKKAAARVETEEEKKLREEIEGLRKKMEALVSGTSVPPAGGERAASADASAPDAAATAATAEGSSSSESEREAISNQIAAKEEELKKIKESWVAKARHAAAAGGGGAAPRQPGERQDGLRGDRGRPDGAKVDARRREPERVTAAASGSRW